MKPHRRLSLVFCALIVFLVLLPRISSGREDAPKPTTLRVLLPDPEATIMVDDKDIPEKSLKKIKGGQEFVAPPPAKGKKTLEVTAVWHPNNYTCFYRTRKIEAKPGETIVVDLRKPDKKALDNIEIRYVPTPDDVVDRMCKLAKVTKEDIVYDLGCGDGRIVLTAVGDFKAKRGVGVDLDPERVKDSIANAKRLKLTDKVEFREQDVLKIKDLSDATVVMLYMGDDVNLRLRPILKKTLKPGSRIVSHRFEMGDWKPDKSETFIGEDKDEYTIHLWTIKK